MMRMFVHRRQGYDDKEIVIGLQNRNRKIEEWFYKKAQTYYNNHFNEIFFDKDRKQEIFQTAFLKLWTEISNGKISVKEGSLSRQQATGQYKEMTCNLTTFLMAFAKNENRELLRNCHEDGKTILFDNAVSEIYVSFDEEDDIKSQQIRIVDDCIQSLSPHCVEILTLFYYKGKSLDEILEIRKGKNENKNGLKSAKTKCMATLKERTRDKFAKYKINI